MKPKKIIKLANDVKTISKSNDPGRTAGRMVRVAFTAAHPVAGVVGGKLIEEGTKKLVDKGIEIAKNPENQRRAKEAGKQAADVAARAARRGANAVKAKVIGFKAGHKKNG
jgi:hypothetical protein